MTDMTVYVTIRGVYGQQVTKTGDALSIVADETGSTIVFRLTQQETLTLTEGDANVQVRFIDANGVAMATDIVPIQVKRILLPGVIEYQGE